MTLDKLKLGEKAVITKLDIEIPKVKKRLIDIGFVPGNTVFMYKKLDGKKDLSIVICCGSKYAIRNDILRQIQGNLLVEKDELCM